MNHLVFFRVLILEPLFTLFYFPVWWYSQGFVLVVNFLKKKIQITCQNLALKTLFSFLFKPMYGDYSREGRLISFFMRLIHLSFRLFQLTLLIIFSLIFIIFYLFLPLFTVYQVVCHFGHFCYYFLWPEII
ncbi:MAG: hypothetical protein N2259_03125 [Patescibacteria group bacterium]|nr:hypothetical protein [Patescibacteria group bacterium]